MKNSTANASTRGKTEGPPHRKFLVITSLFPRPRNPLNGIFNYHTLKAINKKADITVISPVSWIDNLRELVKPITNRDGKSQTENHDDELKLEYSTFFSIPYLGRGLNGYFQYRSMKRIVKKLLQAENFDLVLSYWAYPDGYAASLLAKEFSMPYAIVALGSDLNIMGFSSLTSQPLRSSLAGATAVITVSTALREKAISLGADPNRSFVVPNGVDHRTFHPMGQGSCKRELGMEVNQRILLYVGTMDSVKGPDVLIEALAKIKEAERPLSIMVGSGPLRGKIMKLSKKLGLAGSIRFFDYVPHRRLPVFFNAADLIVLPSRHEGCPNVILEALSCGTPVVATRVGGIPELVDDEDLGILTEPDDPQSLANAISDFFHRNWDRSNIAKRKTRTWHDVARETIKIIERFIGEGEQ